MLHDFFRVVLSNIIIENELTNKLISLPHNYELSIRRAAEIVPSGDTELLTLLLDLLVDLGIFKRKGENYVRTRARVESYIMDPWLSELYELVKVLFDKNLPKALSGYRQGIDGDDPDTKVLYDLYIACNTLNLARFLAAARLRVGEGTLLYLMPTVDNMIHYLLPRLRGSVILIDWRYELLSSELSIYDLSTIGDIVVVQADIPMIHSRLRELGIDNVDRTFLINALQYIEPSRRILYLSSIRIITREILLLQWVYDDFVGKIMNLFTYIFGSWLSPTLTELKNSLYNSGFEVGYSTSTEYGHMIIAT